MRLARELACMFLLENNAKVDTYGKCFVIPQTFNNYRIAEYHEYESNVCTIGYSVDRFYLGFSPWGWNAIARVLLLQQQGLFLS